MGLYLAAILFHVPQSLPPVGTGTDCTLLITHQDKKLKCHFCFFIFWLSLISDTFLMQYVCQASSHDAQWPGRSCESGRASLKYTEFTLFSV